MKAGGFEPETLQNLRYDTMLDHHLFQKLKLLGTGPTMYTMLSNTYNAPFYDLRTKYMEKTC